MRTRACEKKRDEWCLVAREKEEGIPIETRDPTKKRDRFFSLSRTVFSKFDFQGRRFFIFFFFSLDIGDSARDSAFGSFKIGAIDVTIGQVYFSVVFSFHFEN